MALYIDNAISWAQWRLRGGMRRLLIGGASYLGIAIFLIMLPYGLSTSDRDKHEVLQVCSMFLLAAQTAMMLPLAGAMVAGALRRDLTTQLIESHRLMPLSPVQAIVGYIAGGAQPMLMGCAINFLIGAVLCQARSVPVTGWMIANGLLFGFSVAVWSAMALTAFVARAMLGAVIGIFFGIAFSGGFIFVVMPGLLAFCSPMQGHTIFDYTSLEFPTTGAMVAIGAQFLITVLCIRGAARKYADGNAVSLTLGPALATLGIWSGLSWVALRNFSELRPRYLDVPDIDWHLLVVGAVASSLLVAMMPLAAVAWTSIDRRQRFLDGDKVRRSPWGMLTCFVGCMLFVLAPLSAPMDALLRYPGLQPSVYMSSPPTAPAGSDVAVRLQTSAQAAARLEGQPGPSVLSSNESSLPILVGTCAIFLLQAYFLMLLFYPKAKRPNVVILLLTVLLWFIPLMADAIYYGEHGDRVHLDVFGVFSPLGSLAQGLDTPAPRTWLGLAGQAILCGIFGLLVLAARRKRKPTPPPLPVGFAADL